MGIAASLAAFAAVLAFAHAACDTARPRVLVWGTSTDGLGDVESILAIRDFVASKGAHPTVAILVTNEDQFRDVKSHLDSRNEEDSPVLASDIAQYVPERVNLVMHFIPSWNWYGFCKETARKKLDVEKKLERIGADFDKTVCYFNSACIFVRGKCVFVTPENTVENSFTIREYCGSTETLWLSPRKDMARGDYYFAYFYYDYGASMARFLVSLRELLQDTSGRVRVVTNAEYRPEDIAWRIACVLGKPGWTSMSRKHWTECNPESAALLRENGVAIHESDNKLVGVEICGVVFELEATGHVSAAEFDSLLLNSGEYVGCTGDSSLSKVLSSGRVPLYQVREHKKEFVDVLERMWTEVGGDKQSFDTMKLQFHGGRRLQMRSEQDVSSLWKQYRRFVDRLFERTTQDELEMYLHSEAPAASSAVQNAGPSEVSSACAQEASP